MDGPYKGQYSCPQSGRTPRGFKIQTCRTPRRITVRLVHKMDGPHKGSIFMSTKWTDPTRVNRLTKSTKWTNPTRFKYLIKSTKWTDPTRDQYSYPQSGRTPRGLTVRLGPQSGRTPRGINIHIHKVNGPHQG